MTSPGAPATPDPAHFPSGGGGEHTWNPFIGGQLGSSALKHTSDIGPFRAFWIQVTPFSHLLHARRWTGRFSCLFAFIFSCNNSQAACPVRPR